MAKVVTMGEIMLRLSTPNNERFLQADEFDVCYGGGEANVAVSLANYGIETLLPDKSVNPIARLILTICLEISAYERNLLKFRMSEGYRNYLLRRQSNPELRLGRQGYKKDEESYRKDYAHELSLLRKGISMRNVQKLTGTSLGTLQKIKQFL